jgi:SAM-dependent methyltransferase
VFGGEIVPHRRHARPPGQWRSSRRSIVARRAFARPNGDAGDPHLPVPGILPALWRGMSRGKGAASSCHCLSRKERPPLPVLDRIADLRLRPPARGCYDRVSLTVAESDRMYVGDARHYLQCGASALTVIHAAVILGGVRPALMLDFGAGAGRVTRWLRAQWPTARIGATDLREEDLGFCAAEFGCDTWVSGTDIAALAAPSRYDVIWAGSVLTHLDAARSAALLGRLLTWTRPEGIVVASLHGRHAAERGPSTGYYGVGEERWAQVVEAYESTGYGYADYPWSEGYGVSLCRPAWTTTFVEQQPAARLLLFGERLWDAHHDIIALQRAAAG